MSQLRSIRRTMAMHEERIAALQMERALLADVAREDLLEHLRQVREQFNKHTHTMHAAWRAPIFGSDAVLEWHHMGVSAK